MKKKTEMMVPQTRNSRYRWNTNWTCGEMAATIDRIKSKRDDLNREIDLALDLLMRYTKER